MDILIREINEGIKSIIASLEQKREESSDALNIVQKQIDDKIEEAKNYKLDVDNAKGKINILESEISSLEQDLNDLNDRFGKKDLNSIIEAGNKEINNKIITKQNGITKYREKIGELTEKARTIKDLLINLKKDKQQKEDRLNNIEACLNYYKERLTGIIDFAYDHVDNLESYKETVEPKVELIKPSEKLVIDDSPVFDEIESIDSDDTDEDDDEEVATEIKKAPKMDFKTLNDSIDAEYADIFGDNDEIKIDKSIEEPIEVKKEIPLNLFNDELPDNDTELDEEEINEPTEIDHSGLTETDIFGNNYRPEKEIEDDTNLVNFFTKLGIDYYSFKIGSQEYLKKVFNQDIFMRIIDVLRRNNIDINNVYDAPNIFGETTPAELEHIINKLFLAGQTSKNIGFVLSSLPLINSFDLNEVIKSYGPNVKNIDITDLISKTKHLSDMGGVK